ncbi:MAG: sugar ABC transporter ATP-binding protein [Steroidobacteraceae bacterium]
MNTRSQHFTVRADTEPSSDAILELRNVKRTFGAFHALQDVNFKVQRGRVLGVIGENGAGKSTLLNIICGTDRQTSGEVIVRGTAVAFQTYYDAACNGVFRVFQELALIPTLTVWENLFLGHEQLLTRFGVIARNRAIKLAQDVLRRFDHSWLNVESLVGDLPFSVQQLVEILRAFALAELLNQGEPILLLDEPTAGLSSEEIIFLHSLVDKVRVHSAILFVSHRLSELLTWSDDVLVLKDGVVIGTSPANVLTEDQLHKMMVGRERASAFYCEDRQRSPDIQIVLRTENLGDKFNFIGVDATLRSGEILGVTGVIGSGKSELGRALFEGGKDLSGIIQYKGLSGARPSARASSLARIGYVSPDRKEEGILDTLSVMQNISIARLAIQSDALVDRQREREECLAFAETMKIKIGSPHASILSLSGGNQQKAILARWLARGVDLLILDNPTRGIDASAKSQIYALLRDFTESGLAILLISDDLLEVIGLSNRILVMKDKLVTAEIDAPPDAKPNESELIAMMV